MLKSFWMGIMALFLISLSAVAPALAGEGLSEAEVRQFLAKGDAAANAKNFGQMLAMIAPDAKIEISLEGQTTVLDREQYAQLLNQGKSMLKGYHYQSKIHAIQISGNKATIKATAYESADLGENGNFTSTTQEVSTVEKRGGKLLVTTVRSTPVLSK